MPKTCRVKILTGRPRKRRGFCGNNGKKDTDVNSDVNIDNSVDNDCGDPNNISGLSANKSTASDKKVVPIEVSTQIRLILSQEIELLIWKFLVLL